MRLFSIAAILGLLISLPAAAQRPHASPPQKQRIVLIVDEIAALRNFPVMVAERLGYLKNDRYDVTVMDIRPDVDLDEMLADGRADAAFAYWHHAVAGQADGRPMQVIATLGVTPGAKLMVANRALDRIKSSADLAGARVIAGGPNSAKTTVANAFILSGPVAIGNYVRLAPPDKTAIATMLRDGEADLVVARTPDAIYYETVGVATALADLTSVEGTRSALGSLFPTTSVYMMSAKVRSDPGLAQHLASAFVRTMRYLNEHSVEEIAALIPKQFQGVDRPLYLAGLRESLAMYRNDGRMPAGAAEYELGVLRASSSRYAKVDAGATYTNQFVDAALRNR